MRISSESSKPRESVERRQFHKCQQNRSIMYLRATKYDKPNGTYGLRDSNPCPSSAIGAGRLAVLQLGLVPTFGQRF